MSARHALAAWLACCLLSGCTSFGPSAVRSGRFDYNEAIVRTFDEQLLLNLVRLRYRDTPYFLEISNVSTQYELRGDARASVTGGDDDLFDLGAGVGYVERPTIVYAPLAGEDFARRLLAPLSPESLLLLTGAGWRVDRVLRCGVVRINDLWNAPEASGPTPDAPPAYAEFREAATLLSEIRQEHGLRLDYDGADGRRTVILRFTEEHTGTAPRERLAELLGLDAETREFAMLPDAAPPSPSGMTLATRSLIGVLYFLSQAVDAPQRDVDAGRVTVTRNDDGSPFDWALVLGDLFAVRSSLEEPDDAFVKVRYREAWFYIDDSDLSSKSTFNLLGQLFNLQAGEVRGEAPLLTLPVGP